MTDDDCRLHPDYFIALARCFAALGGSAIVGGRILPGDPDDLPITIKLEDHPMIATPDRFPGGFVMGANLAMTRDVLHRVGAFDERFGAGAPFRAAEDMAVMRMIARMTLDQAPAIELFRHLGFVPMAILPDQVMDQDGQRYDLLVMHQDIERFADTLRRFDAER